MKINELVNNDIVDFSAIPPQYFLLGLLSAFENRFQAMADKMMGEISWKQFFAIICIQMCKEAPTINDLSDVLGSSHQNVKQILLKLEAKGFIRRDEPGFICTPLVSQEEMQKKEASTLLNKVFGGSRKALFSALLEDEKLSDKEIKDLKALIDKR